MAKNIKRKLQKTKKASAKKTKKKQTSGKTRRKRKKIKRIWGIRKELIIFFIYKSFPFVVIWVVLGLILVSVFHTVPNWFTFENSCIPADKWGKLTMIYCLSIAGATLLINPLTIVMRTLFKLDSSKDIRNANLWPAMLVGACEAVLYPFLLIINKPDFIGGWLAIKVGGNWKIWQEGHSGRNRFNMFLIGNAVSIIIAVIFAHIIRAAVIKN